MRGRTFLIWIFGIIIGMNTLGLSGTHLSEPQGSLPKCIKRTNIVRIRKKEPEETFGTINLDNINQDNINLDNINIHNINLDNINDEPETSEPKRPLISNGPRQYCSNPIGLLYTNGDIYPVPEQDIPSGKQKAVGIIFPNRVIHPIMNGLVSNTHMRTPIGVVCKNKDTIYPLPKWPPCLECEPLGVMYPDGIILELPSRLSTSNNKKLVAILNTDGTVTSVDQTELGSILDIDEQYHIMPYISGVDDIKYIEGLASGSRSKPGTMTEYLLAKQQLNKQTDNQSKANVNVIIAAKKVADATAGLQAAERLKRRISQKPEVSPEERAEVTERMIAAQLALSNAVAELAGATAALKSAEKTVQESKTKFNIPPEEETRLPEAETALQVPQSRPEEILAKAKAALKAAEELVQGGEGQPEEVTAVKTSTAKPLPLTSKEKKEAEKAAKEKEKATGVSSKEAKEAEKAAKEKEKASGVSSKEAKEAEKAAKEKEKATKVSSKEAKAAKEAEKAAQEGGTTTKVSSKAAEADPSDIEIKLAEAKAAVLLAEAMLEQSRTMK